MDNSSGPNAPREFIDYVNRETQKLLENFNAAGGDNLLQQWTQSWTDFANRSLTDPGNWMQSVTQYQQAQLQLMNNFFANQPLQPVASPEKGDRRFNGESWSENPIYDYIKQSYLLGSELLKEIAGNANLEPQQQKKLAFYTQQYIDAISPSNFAATNPEVMQQAIDSQGQSLVDGMKNLLADIEKGRISMTDESAFTLGENIAVTPGEVVYQTPLFQLIQYRPSTEQVFEKPTLIIPPCINKYYIMDLQPHNSYVNYCVEQGQTVFLISWANPTAEQSQLSWDDYVGSGVIEAIEQVKAICDTTKLNTVAWCIGGTLTACALAVLADRKDNSVASATFLTSLTDFSEPGDLGVFIDEQQVQLLTSKVNQQGVLNGRELATSFNLLRANDLIWSYVVNNYLKGQAPAPFDILYWNGDSTNLPAAMYSYYIEKMYLENSLVEPGKLEVCGSPVDLGKVKTPCYFLSAIEDHIAPWKTTFIGTEKLSGNIEFVLGASGHVAGVINPASKNRRHYWSDGELGQGADHWFESATRQEGSWWPHWAAWLKKRAGKKVAARDCGSKTHPVIESAPGSYVKVRHA